MTDLLDGCLFYVTFSHFIVISTCTRCSISTYICTIWYGLRLHTYSFVFVFGVLLAIPKPIALTGTYPNGGQEIPFVVEMSGYDTESDRWRRAGVCGECYAPYPLRIIYRDKKKLPHCSGHKRIIVLSPLPTSRPEHVRKTCLGVVQSTINLLSLYLYHWCFDGILWPVYSMFVVRQKANMLVISLQHSSV